MIALKQGAGSFADVLIGALGARAGCSRKVTFDRKTLRLPGFQVVGVLELDEYGVRASERFELCSVRRPRNSPRNSKCVRNTPDHRDGRSGAVFAACHATIRPKIAKNVCRDARIVPNSNVKQFPAGSIWGMSVE
jgi:hypothetical protein